MNKLLKNEKGFGAVEALLIAIIVVLIGAVGFLVYKDGHKTTTVVTKTVIVTPKSTASKSTTTVNSQKYINITDWGVRVPYQGSDTLSVSAQTCDTPDDTVLTGCSVGVNSQELANSVGSCQSTRATGTVGYFYRMGTNDNYSWTNGSGYEPVAQWAAENQGQYTQIGAYYYAFDEIGAAWGGSGTDVIKTSTHALADTTPAGCSNWMTEYNTVEPSIQALASKFEAIPN